MVSAESWFAFTGQATLDSEWHTDADYSKSPPDLERTAWGFTLSLKLTVEQEVEQEKVVEE